MCSTLHPRSSVGSQTADDAGEGARGAVTALPGGRERRARHGCFPLLRLLRIVVVLVALVALVAIVGVTVPVLTSLQSSDCGTSGSPTTTVPPSIAVPPAAGQQSSVGGFTFTVRATAHSDLFIERSISAADAEAVAAIADVDVLEVQTTYGRAYSARPPVYVFPTPAAYTTGLQTVMGESAAQAAAVNPLEAGVLVGTKVALDWQKVRAERPFTTLRHELTHLMIAQIAKPGAEIPAWINEGSARLEEFTITGTQELSTSSRYEAASMVAVGNYFSVPDLASQETWRSRQGFSALYEYSEAAQIVQLLRDDVGIAGEVRIFDLMGQGRTFDAAFQTVTGKTLAAFSSTIATRLRALSASYPYLATADTPDGGLIYILYGFQPSSTVTLDIVDPGQEEMWRLLRAVGVKNAAPNYSVNAYGVSEAVVQASRGTYTFTATGLGPPSSTQPSTSVTFTVHAVASCGHPPGG